MVANAPTTVDVLYNRVSGKQIVFIWGGTNDMAIGGANSTTIYNAIKAYATARKGVGWQVVILSMLPRQTSPSWETTRQAVNTSLRADFTTPTADPNIWTGGGYGDVLIDVGSDATIGAPGAQMNTTYYPDQIHLTNAGYAIVGAYAKTAALLL